MKITNPQIEEALQVLRKTNNHTYKSFSETSQKKKDLLKVTRKNR